MDTNVVRLAPRPDLPAGDSSMDSGRRLDLDSLPLLLAVPRAAKILGISRSGAYRLAETGELPVKRLGGRIYVVTAKLLDLVAAA